MVSPARRRDASAICSVGTRCRSVGRAGWSGSIARRSATSVCRPSIELRLVKEMNELAAAHPRWGYRRVWSLLRSEGWRVNRKRIERLWRLEGHRVPPGAADERGQPGAGDGGAGDLEPAGAAAESRLVVRLHEWRALAMVARCGSSTSSTSTHAVAVGCRVARSIGARDVIAELEQLFERHGKPQLSGPTTAASSSPPRSANGSPSRVCRPHSSRKAARSRTRSSSASTARCATRSSTARSSTELARGPRRDRRLGRIQPRRPHRGLGMMTPAQFAADARADQNRRRTNGAA